MTRSSCGLYEIDAADQNLDDLLNTYKDFFRTNNFKNSGCTRKRFLLDPHICTQYQKADLNFHRPLCWDQSA